MKTSKLLSLVAGIAMVASVFATTASAATVGPDEKPVASVEVFNVTAAGLAIVDVKLSIDADLQAYKAVLDEETYEETFYGKGIKGIQTTLFPNDEIFDISTLAVIDGNTLTGCNAYTKSDGSVEFTFQDGNDKKAWKVDKELALCRFRVKLNDTSITKEELAAMADIVDFTYVLVRTQAYPAAGAAKASDLEFDTEYILDTVNNTTGHYTPSVIEGAEKQPEPPVDEKNYGDDGNEFEGKASKYWKVDFAEWTGTADVSLTDGTRTETINVTTAEGSEDYVIGGAVSFYVYVIGDADAIADVYIVE